MNDISYSVITPMPIVVVVDADSTSAIISWEYECKYKENDCDYCGIYGSESMEISLEPLDKCSGNTISSSFTWNGIGIEYQIIRIPNPTYEPRVEYQITKLSGCTVNNGFVSFKSYSGDCGEGKDVEVEYEYKILTYENDCTDIPTETSSSGTTILSFDCTYSETGSSSISSTTNILGNDIIYEYGCYKCDGISCKPSTNISRLTVLSYSADNKDYTDIGLPCSGKSEITAEIKYYVVKVDKDCNKEAYYATKTLSGLSVAPCKIGDSRECCSAHLVLTENPVNIEGKEMYLQLLMAADEYGDCDNGCARTCESAITTTLKSWTLTYKNRVYSSDNISTLPVIPLGEKSTFKFNYEVDINSIYENCKTSAYTDTHSGTVIIESADCEYHTYGVLTNGNKTENFDGCIDQTPMFEVKSVPDTYPTTGDDAQVDPIWAQYTFINKTRDDETEYSVTIEFPYNREKCKEFKE